MLCVRNCQHCLWLWKSSVNIVWRRFERTWRWVNDGRRFMFVCTIPLTFFLWLFLSLWIWTCFVMNPSLNSSALYSLRFGFNQHHFCRSQTRLVTCSDQKRHDVDHSFGFCPSVKSDWLNSICALIGCDRCGQMKCVRLIVQNGADWIQVCISRSTATDLVTCMTSHFFLSFFSFFPYRLPLYQSSLMSVVIMPSAILLWFSCVWALFRPWAQHLPSALRFPSHAPPPLEQQPITRRLRSPLRICTVSVVLVVRTGMLFWFERPIILLTDILTDIHR